MSTETIAGLEAQMAASDRACFELISTMTDTASKLVAEGTGYYQMRHSR